MLTVFEVTLPVFGLVFCGWLAAHRRMMSDEAVSGINAFVFWFALPAMLFRAVAANPVAELAEPRYLSAYALAALAMFFGTRLLARAASGDGSVRTAFALNAAHGNIGYLGLPLLAQLGGQSGALGAIGVRAMITAIIVDIFLVILISIVLFEMDRGRRAARSDGAAPLSRLAALRLGLAALVRSPLILGIAAGLVASLVELELPPVADSFTSLLAAAAGPCALFAIGASLGGRPVVVDRQVSGLLALKLLVHPLLMAFTTSLLKVDPRAAAIGILVAALPSASNTYILAQRYGVDTRAISASIVVGTGLAAVSVTAVIWWLDLLGP
jgi:malonate transporter and related proteins